MHPYKASRFFSSLKQVEKRISSEESHDKQPLKRKHKEPPNPLNPNEGLTNLISNNPYTISEIRNEFVFEESKIANTHYKVTQEFGNANTKNPQNPSIRNPNPDLPLSSMPSESYVTTQSTEFGFGSQIVACRAQPFIMPETLSTENSVAAPEFFSFPENKNHVSGNLQEGYDEESCEEFADMGEEEYVCEDEAVEAGDIDEIVELCGALKLDPVCLFGNSVVDGCSSSVGSEIQKGNGSHHRRYVNVGLFSGGLRDVSEVEAMDAWIRHFVEQNKEPFRLVHLLLAKSFTENDGDVLEFPETVREFLTKRPPLLRLVDSIDQKF